MELSGKTALVTGAAKRVGREIALTLARAGADIILHHHSSEAEAAETAREIEALGRRTEMVRADLSNAADTQKLAAELAARTPPIDILINCASVFYKTTLSELTLEHWEENLAVNARAPFLLSLELGRTMKFRGAGKIINIADAAIRRPYRGYMPYLVSKFALAGLTEVLALELAPEVQVNAVAPGTVLLPDGAPLQMKQSILRRTPLGRIGSPTDVAQMVLFLAAKSDFSTGGIYSVDGGAGIAP